MRKIYLFTVSLFIFVLTANAQDIETTCCKNVDSAEKVNDIETALNNIETTTVLDLSMQEERITLVPNEISKLKNLKCLDLSFNRVATFHSSFAELQKLECLDLSGNHYLNTLPAFFKKMPNLKVILLEDLNWTNARQEKIKKQFPNITFIF